MLPVSSLQNPNVKLVRSLSDKKARKEGGQFVAEGLAMLERAEDLGWLPDVVIATKTVQVFTDVKPVIVTDKVMAELSAQNNPHDVLAIFKQKHLPHAKKEGVWLALEEIRDPGNLGTILRTVDAAGLSGVILLGECCDVWSGDSVRASTGSIFAVPIVKMGIPAFADLARGWGGDVVGTAAQAKLDFKMAYERPCLIILGSEARGLSDAVSKACTKLVRIPMKPGVESLNIASSAALLAYEAMRSG